MINVERANKAIGDIAKMLPEQSLTGEDYLFVLQTLVAHVLAVNPPRIKKIWLMNLNADVLARRKQQLEMSNGTDNI